MCFSHATYKYHIEKITRVIRVGASTSNKTEKGKKCVAQFSTFENLTVPLKPCFPIKSCGKSPKCITTSS